MFLLALTVMNEQAAVLRVGPDPHTYSYAWKCAAALCYGSNQHSLALGRSQQASMPLIQYLPGPSTGSPDFPPSVYVSMVL